MEPSIIAGSIVGAFVAGVVVAKYVISEAQSVKDHISTEIAAWRVDVAKLINRA